MIVPFFESNKAKMVKIKQENSSNVSKNVQCDYCKKEFKRKAILKSHFFSKHFDNKVFCPICDKKFISNSVRNRHLRLAHSVENHKKINNSGNELGNKLETRAFQPNHPFPVMMDAFQKKETVGFGKHLVAKEDIFVGNTVMVSTAFASVEYLLCIGDSCFQCGKQFVAAKEIRCQHCINVRFCSRMCSLSRVHRTKCNQMFDQNDCETVRLVLEIIDKASKFFPDVTVFLEFCAHVIVKGKSHKDCKPPFSYYNEILQLKRKPEQNHFDIAKRIVSLVKLLPQFAAINTVEHNRTLFHLAYRHTIALNLNTFSDETVLTKGGLVTRLAIHDTLSRFNHSCVPNVHHCIDKDNETHCVTIRPIKKGDQIFINYLGEKEFEDEEDRRRYLEETWGFNCCCEKCRLRGLKIDNYSGIHHKSYLFIEQNFKQIKSKELKKECIQFLNETGHLWSKPVEFATNCFKDIIHHL